MCFFRSLLITRPEWLHNQNVFQINCVMNPDSMVAGFSGRRRLDEQSVRVAHRLDEQSVRVAPLQNKIAPKSFNSKTKFEMKSETKSLKNARNVPKKFKSCSAVLKFFTGTFSLYFERNFKRDFKLFFFAQQESAGVATLTIWPSSTNNSWQLSQDIPAHPSRGCRMLAHLSQQLP